MGLQKQARMLTPDEIARVEQWISSTRQDGARDLVIFYLSVYAGLRSKEIAGLTWLEQRVVDPPPDRLLAEELGAGEAEVITLALRVRPREVLLDERRARRIAEVAYHLPVRGTAGLLVAAKRARLIPLVRPLMDAMRDNGYYLSQRLLDAACAEVGE